jgi:hypothetical protein
MRWMFDIGKLPEATVAPIAIAIATHQYSVGLPRTSLLSGEESLAMTHGPTMNLTPATETHSAEHVFIKVEDEASARLDPSSFDIPTD